MSQLSSHKPSALVTLNDTAQNWWFVLGREAKLSAAEILNLFAPKNFRLYSGGILKIESTRVLPLKAIECLGGTVKIGLELGLNLPFNELTKKMFSDLSAIPGKAVFGLSFFGCSDQIPALKTGMNLKAALTKIGRPARYVFNQETVLSSATVEKNKLVSRGREFLILQDQDKFSLAKTVAVQPFKEWSRRDYGRPARDAKSGMLPPKLARIMINIAHASGGQALPPPEKVLLDPFSGSGTILTEALLLGYKNIMGSDISEAAIKDSKKNIAWIIEDNKFAVGAPIATSLSVTDARDLSKKISMASVDVIVTEPFLGPPLRGREKIEVIKKTALELNHLYFQAFKEFKKVLRPGGVVVFIFPRFLVGGEWITVSNRVAPDIAKLGFAVELLLPKKINLEPFGIYHRPNQLVGREIWKFCFSSHQPMAKTKQKRSRER